MAVIYIGNTYTDEKNNDLKSVIAPNEMSETFSDLDAASTTRTASGLMVRSVVRGGDNNVRSIELKWQNVPVQSVKSILGMVKGTYFYMKYPDLQTGTNRVGHFYCGDRKCTIKRINADDNKPFVKELTFNLIER